MLDRHAGDTPRGRPRAIRTIIRRGRITRARKIGGIRRTRRMPTRTVMPRRRRAEQSKHHIFLLSYAAAGFIKYVLTIQYILKLD